MSMNDTKNIFLAGFSSLSSFIYAIDTPTLITIISAIILPLFFFCIGKTVDVCMQIHFRRQEARRQLEGKADDEQ